MSASEELQALDEAEVQRALDAARRRELVQQVAAEKEQAAEVAAKSWAEANVLAVKKLDGQLDELLERLEKNPNQRDTSAANTVWGHITRKLELHGVMVYRFPRFALAGVPALAAPGRRTTAVGGLSIAQPRRHLFPIVTASDSAQLRGAIFARAAWEWLRSNVGALPLELLPVVEAEVPEPDMAERRAREAADRVRQLGVRA